MTPASQRKPADSHRVAICLTLLFFAFTSCMSVAQEGPSSETATLREAVRIPLEVQGKQVGATSVPAGTKVTVEARDGDRVSIKRGNLGPVWIRESQVSGLAAKQPKGPEPSATTSSTTPEKLSALISGKKWAEAASACEALAKQDKEKFSFLAEFGNQLRSALQAKVTTVSHQIKAQAEAKRLRRNADVIGQPNPLNPSDNSPMERAQKLREQADTVIEEVKEALEKSETQIAQTGANILSEVSQIESEERKSAEMARSEPSEVDQSNPMGGLAETLESIKSKAEGGDAIAQNRLGVIYAPAAGKEDQQKRLQKLLHGTDDNGFTRLSTGGEVVPTDYVEAAKWFRKSAEQGYADAQCNLGLMYQNGKGVPQDHEEAAKWFRKSAEQGWAKAQFHLGNILYLGLGGVPQNYVEALKWFQRSAELGHGSSQIMLAGMYKDGEGVPQDFIKSYIWYSVGGPSGDAIRQLMEEAAAKLSPEALTEAKRQAAKLQKEIESRPRKEYPRESQTYPYWPPTISAPRTGATSSLQGSEQHDNPEVADNDSEGKKKAKLQAALLVLDRKIATHTHEDALAAILRAIDEDRLPKIGLTLDECIVNCPIDADDPPEKNLRVAQNMAIHVGNGWTKVALPCGDIDAVLVFGSEGRIEDVKYSHSAKVLDCSDKRLASAISGYNGPTASWSNDIDEQKKTLCGIAKSKDGQPLAVMLAEPNYIHVMTTRAFQFWEKEKHKSGGP